MKRNKLHLPLVISIVILLIGCDTTKRQANMHLYRDITIKNGEAIEPFPQDSVQYYQTHYIPYIKLISKYNGTKDYKVYLAKDSLDISVQKLNDYSVFKITTPDEKYIKITTYLFYEKRDNKFYGTYCPTNIISASQTLDCFIERFDFNQAWTSNLEISVKDTSHITSILNETFFALKNQASNQYHINFNGGIISYLKRNK